MNESLLNTFSRLLSNDSSAAFEMSELFVTDLPFLVLENISINYQEFYTHIQHTSLEIKKDLQDSERFVAIQITDQYSQLLTIFSLWKLNRAVLILPPDINIQEIENKKRELQFSTVISQKRLFKKYPKVFSAMKIHSLESHAITILTSGSSGPKKAVRLTFKNLLASALGTNQFYKIDHRDQWVLTLPLHHIGGLMIPLRMIMACGSVYICHYKNLKEGLKKYSPSFISLVPTQLQDLISIKELDRFRGIILGGARTPESLLKQACARKLNLANSFGLSEMCAQVTSTPLCHDVELLKTGGKVLPYRELSIASDNRMIFSGKTLFINYHNLKPITSFESKDLGFFDKQGNLNFLERSDSLFISGGENISPRHIEQKIQKECLIETCIIVPVNHYRYGQVPFLFHNSPKELKRIDFKDLLAPHEIPYDFFLLKSLPPPKISSNIKYLKKELIDLANRLFNDQSLPFSISKSGNIYGEVIIFLHGFMGEKEDWSQVIKPLESTYFCISIDLPGHGSTCLDHFSTQQDVINKLIDFINSFKRPINLVGYSLGGRIAAQLKLHSPQLFKKVILESTGLGLNDPKEKTKRFDKDQKLFEKVTDQKEFQDFLAIWYNLPLFSGIKKHPNYDQMISQKKFKNIDDYQKSLSYFSLGKMDFLEEKLKCFDKESLLLIAGEDDIRYSAMAKKSQLPYQIMQGCSHNTHFQNPNQFSKVLAQFFLKEDFLYNRP